MSCEAALSLLNEYHKPDAMVTLLKRIVAWERANPQQGRYHGFELSDQARPVPRGVSVDER